MQAGYQGRRDFSASATWAGSGWARLAEHRIPTVSVHSKAEACTAGHESCQLRRSGRLRQLVTVQAAARLYRELAVQHRAHNKKTCDSEIGWPVVLCCAVLFIIKMLWQ